MMGRGQDSDERRRPRPPWMTFFAVMLLLLGGRFLITSLSDLHHLASGRDEVLTLDGSLDAQRELLLRAQVVLANTLCRERPAALAISALARLGLGLVYLFAVAALFSGDARGRRVSVFAGWFGLAVSASNALFLAWVVRGLLPRILPVLAEATAQDAARAGRPPLTADVLALQTRLFLHDAPQLVAGMGVLWSLLLITYFRGRSVRLFYNQGQADHD
jgi:hypothetical protein